MEKEQFGEAFGELSGAQELSAMGRRVALLLEGSRGDAQPYVAAALALKAAGHEILIIGDQDVADLAKPLGQNRLIFGFKML